MRVGEKVLRKDVMPIGLGAITGMAIQGGPVRWELETIREPFFVPREGGLCILIRHHKCYQRTLQVVISNYQREESIWSWLKRGLLWLSPFRNQGH